VSWQGLSIVPSLGESQGKMGRQGEKVKERIRSPRATTIKFPGGGEGGKPKKSKKGHEHFFS